jgi:hypothetical protein
MPKPGQAIRARVKLGRTPDACWTWLGGCTSSGHGSLTFCGRDVLAHRWIWEQLFGPIPDGHVVFSTCERLDCINPHHLACGTQATACREGVSTKLLPDDVADIRAAKADAGPNTVRVLAERYGVSITTIRDIWLGRSWTRARKNHGPKAPANQHTRAA